MVLEFKRGMEPSLGLAPKPIPSPVLYHPFSPGMFLFFMTFSLSWYFPFSEAYLVRSSEAAKFPIYNKIKIHDLDFTIDTLRLEPQTHGIRLRIFSRLRHSSAMLRLNTSLRALLHRKQIVSVRHTYDPVAMKARISGDAWVLWLYLYLRQEASRLLQEILTESCIFLSEFV